jgi:hypothetical protein
MNQLFSVIHTSLGISSRARKHGLYIALSVLSALTVFDSSSSIAGDIKVNPLDKLLKPYADRQNTKLPTIVAENVRQERTTVFNGVISISYTILVKTAAELAPMNLGITQRKITLPLLCQASDTGRMLREGISFRYAYFGKDGRLASEFVVIPADCASIR